MGRHSRGVVERRGKQALAIAAAAGSEGLGVALISWGNHLSAENYYYDVVPWGFWGAVFIALPVIALANRVVAGIARAVAAEHRRYREWKAALTPEQRAAVELAEAAAATAAAIAMWEHHKRVDARLTSSVMGRTMPDGHTGHRTGSLPTASRRHCTTRPRSRHGERRIRRRPARRR